jgi:peptidoglycan/LPS O-acetylase OafA/YrhL
MTMPDRTRYHGLDAMRGIAALSVVVFHIGDDAHRPLFPHAYLSVDFFFMLSGFVLAKAYEPRLGALGPARFLELRLIRLYPLFMLGVLLGIPRIVSQVMGPVAHPMTAVEALLAFVLNALMLPAPTSPFLLFPFNVPAWSLFLEIAINVGFAVLFYRMASRLLAVCCLGAGLLLALAILRMGDNDLGAVWSTAGFGLFRVCFSFLLGMLLARMPARGKKSSAMACLPIIALALTLAFPWPLAFGAEVDLMAVFLLLPALLWLGTRIELPKMLQPLGAALGDISYPLYAIHFPLLQIFLHVFLRGFHLPLWLVSLAFLASASWLAFFLAHHFDAPVRRWLGGRGRLGPTPMPVGS